MATSINSLADDGEAYIGQVPFSVMARVALQLGRESISNSLVAITELVKNAYDADAENVYISFRGIRSSNPILVIEDDGVGMTQQQLERQWMVIGTPNKLFTGRSRNKGRVLTGEKGLGRLGLDRLCTHSIIHTFVDESELATKLSIDWTKYEEIDERLEEVRHDIYATSKSITHPISRQIKTVGHGTILTLLGLKDTWTQETVARLRDELSLLVSPFAGVNDFSIHIESGENWKAVDGTIGSHTMLEAAEWKLLAKLSHRGHVTFHMSSSQFDEDFRFGPEPWQEVFKDARHETPECGPLEFHMYFYPRRPVSIGEIKVTLSHITSFLDSNNGIRIYRDNFRVKPYGAPDGTGDWLRLSYRRQQNPQGVTQKPVGSWRVGYNQVVGAVFISREDNKALIDQTNRENLVEGAAFSDMKMFAERAVQFFEINRQEFEIARKNAESSDYDKAKDELKRTSSETEKFVNDAKDIVASALQLSGDGSRTPPELLEVLDDAFARIGNQLEVVRKAQQEYERQAEEQQARLQIQKDTLGNLASLGILATSFGHETLGASNLVLTNAKDLRHDITTSLLMVEPDKLATIKEEIEIILHESDKIETFARFMLRNVRRDARHKQKLFLNQVVLRIFRHFHKVFDEKKIELILNLPEDISPILAYEIDWESIIVNLLTNSVWALEDIPEGQKIIRITLQEDGTFINIFFGDSGKGIEKGTEDQIFLPTISTKRNERGETVGTGMGLAIVKDFIESHDGGQIAVSSPCDLGGAEFHIRVRIPRRALSGKGQSENVQNNMAGG